MYTVEVYKRDLRTKSGERLVRKTDHSSIDLGSLKHLYSKIYSAVEGYRMEYHVTIVTRKNLLSGLPFTERYDTPYFCSPSSETFWST